MYRSIPEYEGLKTGLKKRVKEINWESVIIRNFGQ
jgi:hypothetical protein